MITLCHQDPSQGLAIPDELAAAPSGRLTGPACIADLMTGVLITMSNQAHIHPIAVLLKSALAERGRQRASYVGPPQLVLADAVSAVSEGVSQPS